MDWEAYLAEKGFRGRKATGSEVAYPCFFDCMESQDSRKRKLYVNSETGLYSCKVCVCEGNAVTLMRHFGDEPEQGVDVPTIGRRSEVLECATAVAEEMLGNNEDTMLYLLGPRRCLPPEVVVERRLGYASKQWPLSNNLPEQKQFNVKDKMAAGLLAEGENGSYEFFQNVITIPYIDQGRVVQMRGKDPFGRYYTPVNDAVRMYNVDSLKGAVEAILVEGEFDAMMLAWILGQSGTLRLQNMAVVGIAGTGAIPDDFQHRLAHLRRVFIGSDPDEPGQRAGAKWAELLGDRAVMVQWPATLLQRATADGLELKDIDWTTWIGKYQATVDEVAAVLHVPSRLVSVRQALELHRNRPRSGIQFGFAGLDAAFAPGLLPGQVCVILAKTGVGKTVILCNLAWNLRHKRVLLITLEMMSEEIWVRLGRIGKFYDPFMADETVADQYPLLRICDQNRLNESDYDRLVEEYTEDIGEPPEVVMVDYLGYYARGRKGGNTYEKTSDAVMQLKAHAKGHKHSVIVPSQVNRVAKDGKPLDVDDARDSGVVEETADLMLLMWRSDDALDLNTGAEPSAKLHMKIGKSRHGNRDKVFLLQMGMHSLVLVDDGTREAVKARREAHSAWRGNTYEQYMESLVNVEQELR